MNISPWVKALGLAMLFMGLPAGSATPAQGDAACAASGPSSELYTVTVCLDEPSSDVKYSGVVTVKATASVSGIDPGVRRMIFTLDGDYVLTDYLAPYTFELPTQLYANGRHVLGVEALLRDGFTSSTLTQVIRFNGSELLPTPQPFEPRLGDPQPQRSFVVAAAGDAASGESASGAVADLIAGWNPDMFLYLGDVYDRGSDVEFYNWYGQGDAFFSRFYDITNPVIGNHEYEHAAGAGYFNYWGNPDDYYSFDSAGWHFVALNSTSQFGQRESDSEQYQWLEQDLAANPSPCTLVYYHHPMYSIGSKHGLHERFAMEYATLFADYGVDLAVAGHDHTYQRWTAMDGDGNPDPRGTAHFVVGASGHGVRSFVTTDSRVQVGLDRRDPTFGALWLGLNPDGLEYRYININNEVLDSGVIACSDATVDSAAPLAPQELSATSDSASHVELTWADAYDNTGVAAYDILRDGVLIASVPGGIREFRDEKIDLETTYVYSVKAVDLAGNASKPSNSAQIATADRAIYTLIPVADAFVSVELPDTNFGAKEVIRTDAAPRTHSYLRFALDNVRGYVLRATLRLHAQNGSGIGYELRQVEDNSWEELEITLNNAPELGQPIGAADFHYRRRWSEIEVTSILNTAGHLNIALLTPSSTSLSFDSRESLYPPQLVIETSSEPPSPGLFTFTPVADTYVNAFTPNNNYWGTNKLRQDASPETSSFLRFTVGNMVGTVADARLRFYATSDSRVGIDGYVVENTDWSETGVSFNEAPQIGAYVGSTGRFVRNSRIEIDVSSIIQGNGEYSFALRTTSATANSIYSRQGLYPPELVITTVESASDGTGR